MKRKAQHQNSNRNATVSSNKWIIIGPAQDCAAYDLRSIPVCSLLIYHMINEDPNCIGALFYFSTSRCFLFSKNPQPVLILSREHSPSFPRRLSVGHRAIRSNPIEIVKWKLQIPPVRTYLLGRPKIPRSRLGLSRSGISPVG